MGTNWGKKCKENYTKKISIALWSLNLTGMVPFHLQAGSNARLQATKEEIIRKLRQDMIRWEGFRPPLPGTNNDPGAWPGYTRRIYPPALKLFEHPHNQSP
jgi:hypothetical protein